MGEPREGGGENVKARAEEGPGEGVALPPALVLYRCGWRVVRQPITELDFEITYEEVLSRGEPPELPRDLVRDEEVPLAVRFRS